MNWVYLIFFSLHWFPAISSAEPLDRWIVRTAPASEACLQDWVDASKNLGVTWRKLPLEGWYAVQSPASQSSMLHALPCVLQINEDHKLEWRGTTPNDPSYGNQRDMNLIRMPEAWDLTTGGVTTHGDTIVVAVIDDGFDLVHQDLTANFWYNYAEIPDDGIDNDNNDYVDDYLGYNVSTFNDQHPKRTHGTSVAAVIGARGNNGVGVTGVNWNVKLLLISGADFESELIEAYDYVYKLRKAYNDTQGAKGAFIAVTNLSAGVNGEFAADHPMWCEMYEKLGGIGILSVCAAPNLNISVDVDGDMPTTCGSQYMMAVTNVDLSDNLVGNAGYGATSIDIGAPGHGTVTAASNNIYKEFLGTSAATPHVSGTVALIYSTPCEFFLDELETNPAAVARKVRNLIYETAKPNNSLNELTTTGRRLDTGTAMEVTNLTCAPSTDQKLIITGVNPNPAHLETVEVNYSVIGDTSGVVMELYSVGGATILSQPLSADEVTEGIFRFSTETLAGGVYLITLRRGKDKATRKLFVY